MSKNKLRLSSSAQKIAELIQMLSGGSQREFARLVGCSQPVISRIVNGKQEPGRELLDRIAQLEGVDRESLLATLDDFASHPEMEASVPIAHCLLDSSPSARRENLTDGNIAVSPSLYRSSLYAVRARSGEPAFSNPSEQMRADDLIVIESSVERLRSNIQMLNGKLCVVVVRGPGGRDDAVTLRRVWVAFDEHAGKRVVRTCSDSRVDQYLNEKYNGRPLRSIQLEVPENKPLENQFVDECVDVNDIVGLAIELIRNL